MNDCSEEDVRMFKEEIDRLRNISNTGLHLLDLDPVINDLPEIFPFLSFLTHEGQFDEIKRITINKSILGDNSRISEMSHLSYPPSKFVKSYGRANLKNQSVLYGTFTILTTLNEMKPDVGDLISISTWKLKKEGTLIYTPIFKRWDLGDNNINLNMRMFSEQYQKLSKTYPKNIFEQIDLQNEFVADEFMKTVNRANSDNYLFSAYFANEILYKFATNEGKPIDAILYPSVAEKGAFDNLAIKPEKFDELYRLDSVRESMVITRPTATQKGYTLEGISESTAIEYDKSRIIWKEYFTQPEERMDFYRKTFDLKL